MRLATLKDGRLAGVLPDATDGAAMQKLLAEMYATPQPVQERLKKILAP